MLLVGHHCTNDGFARTIVLFGAGGGVSFLPVFRGVFFLLLELVVFLQVELAVELVSFLVVELSGIL